MRSIMTWYLYGNGNIERIDTGENSNRLFQGQNGTAEYRLIIADNNEWYLTDAVFIAFTRPDGRKSNPPMKLLADNSGWYYQSNGWESDVDIGRYGNALKVSFLNRRYSQFNGATTSQTAPGEEDTVIIHPSPGYTPLNIEENVAEELIRIVADLQPTILHRYDASNMAQYSGVTYSLDGKKTATSMYYNYTHGVTTVDGAISTRSGDLYVVARPLTGNTYRQWEFLLTGDAKPELFVRTLVINNYTTNPVVASDTGFTRADSEAITAINDMLKTINALTAPPDVSLANLVGTANVEITQAGNFKFSYLKGNPGVNGKDGKDGLNGRDGKDGEKGDPGDTGLPGAALPSNKKDILFDVTDWAALPDGGYSYTVTAAAHGFGASRIIRQVDTYENNVSSPLIGNPRQLANGDVVLYAAKPFRGVLQLTGGAAETTDITARVMIEREVEDRKNAVAGAISEAKGYTDSVAGNYVPLTQKGAAQGVATLDGNGKVPLSQMNDAITGQLVNGGVFNPSTAVATLTSNAQVRLGTTAATITLTNNTAPVTGYTANQGMFYICTANGTFAGISFLTGDWLLSTGSGWDKVNNTDAVASVNGKTGVIALNAADVGAAPVSHASTATTHGAGNAANYGHVRLSDSTTSIEGAAQGVAASPGAVKAVRDALDTEVTNRINGDNSTLASARNYTDTKFADAANLTGGTIDPKRMSDTTVQPATGNVDITRQTDGSFKIGVITDAVSRKVYYIAIDWVAGKAYKVGDVVYYNNAYYLCILANSGTSAPPDYPSRWQLVSGNNYKKWTAYEDGGYSYSISAADHAMGVNCLTEARGLGITKPIIDGNGNVAVYSTVAVAATIFIY